jgi:hypothetical protein
MQNPMEMFLRTEWAAHRNLGRWWWWKQRVKIIALEMWLRYRREVKNETGLKHEDVSREISIIYTYLLTPWSRVLLEKLTSKLCS